MWFTRLSIQRPVFVVVFILTFLLLGARSKSGMNVDLNPPVNFPYITVITTYPGTSPEEMETLISKPIEDAVSSINGIEHITSSSQYGYASITVEFSIGVDAIQAESEVREKVDASRAALPKDIDPPTIMRFDISAQPVLYMGMTTELSLKQARFQADKTIEPLLSQVPGVAKVDITGGDTREIQVNVDRAKLTAYGLSVNDIVDALQAANVNLPGGHIQEGRYDFDARVVGEFQSVDQIRTLRIPVPSKDPLKTLYINLNSVAEIIDTVAERSAIARIWSRDASGKLHPENSVGIIVTKDTDANTVNVVDGVKEVLQRMEKELPGNVHFIISQDLSRVVRDQLRDVNFSLIVGALLAVLVVFLFLHDIRGTLICAMAIPISLIATFIPMFFAGFTLNSMTMLGLSLVVGILVDDSIVVLENIYRHLRRGELPAEAAYNGRSEIGLAAITITMVDVVVFLPMAFMGGIVGQFFRQFGLTVSCATLFSLLVSFSVTPMLASRFYRSSTDLEPKEGGLAEKFEKFYSGLDQGYRRFLGWALRNRWLMVIGAFAVFIFTMVVFAPRMGFQFVPDTDQGQLVVTCELPTGASLDASDAAIAVIESRISQIPDIQSIFTSVGSITGSGFTTPQTGPQYAQLSVKLNDKKSSLESLNPFYHGSARTRPDYEIAAEIRKMVADIPGPRIIAVPLAGMGGAGAPVDIELLGFDLVKMRQIAEELEGKLSTLPGIMTPDISLRPGKPEADVIVDRVRASEIGYSVAQIGSVVRTAFAGDTTVKYRDQGDEFDVRVQLKQIDRSNIDQISNLVVGSRGTFGNYEPVYLRDVARIQMSYGPTKVDRLDRQRVVHVTTYLEPDAAIGNIQEAANKLIDKLALGSVHIKWGGQAESMNKEFPYMFATVSMSILLVYLLMAALFDNMLYPLVIQLSMPMALVGAIFALVITHKKMSIFAMIGVIMLVGLVEKNAILLIDYTNTLRSRGIPRNAAIQQAGATRLRPILMTTIAMVFGMMPAALNIGSSSESRTPLAICVIGGLIFSTVLSLVIVPVGYTLFDDCLSFVVRLFARPQDEARTRVRTNRKDPGR